MHRRQVAPTLVISMAANLIEHFGQRGDDWDDLRARYAVIPVNTRH